MAHENFFVLSFLLPRRWRAAMTAEVARFGLTSATARPLFYIGRLGEGVRPKNLAEVLEIERPSLAQLLDRLEAGGLIERRDDVHDRRGKTLHLTAEGRKISRLTADLAERLTEKMVAGVSKDEIALCEKVLGKILANVADYFEHEHAVEAPAESGGRGG